VLIAGRHAHAHRHQPGDEPDADEDLVEFYERNSRKLASLMAIGPSAL
jgi:hypothetical protein